MQSIPIIQSGRESGQAVCEQQGLYTCLYIRTPLRSGLWCAWLIGETGEMRIGILEPSGHDAVIHRKFSRHTLRAVGNLKRVELRRVKRRTESETQQEFFPADTGNILPADTGNMLPADTGNILPADTGNMLEQHHNGIRSIAIPMDCQQPFPIPSLFCFARPYTIRAGTYWIFAFDAAGKPLMPCTVSDAWTEYPQGKYPALKDCPTPEEFPAGDVPKGVCSAPA